MTGDLFIDNLDAYTEWGVSIQDGGYNGLIQYPPLKDVQFTDWPDEDGIEVDLLEPKINIRTFNIIFGSTTEVGRQEFISYLSDSAYHTVSVPELSYTRTLRFMAEPSLRILGNAAVFALQAVDDYPDEFRQSTVPVPSGFATGYLIDGVDLGTFGIRVLEGTDQSIESMPGIKPNLLRANSVSDGAEYTSSPVYYKAKDVILRFNLRADTPAEFFANYLSFYRLLISPEKRELIYPKSPNPYEFYYKSSTVNNFDFRGGLWCDFNIVVTFTSYRVGAINYVLGTEDNNYIVTENNLLIDLNLN